MSTPTPSTVELRSLDSTIAGSGQTLHVRSVLTPQPPIGKVGILHGYGDHSGRYADLQRALGLSGYESHAFDFRGHGISTGTRGAVRRWEDYLEDLGRFLAAALWTPPGAPPSSAPRFLIAHSHGCLVALMAALTGRLPAVKALVLSSPFLAMGLRVPLWKRVLAAAGNLLIPSLPVPSGLRGLPMTHDDDLQRDSETDPLLLHSATPRWFIGALRAQRLVRDRAGEIRLPVLTLLGTADSVAEVQTIRDFQQRLGSADKPLIEYPGMYHELLRERNREQVFADITAFLGRQR